MRWVFRGGSDVVKKREAWQELFGEKPRLVVYGVWRDVRGELVFARDGVEAELAGGMRVKVCLEDGSQVVVAPFEEGASVTFALVGR